MAVDDDLSFSLSLISLESKLKNVKIQMMIDETAKGTTASTDTANIISTTIFDVKQRLKIKKMQKISHQIAKTCFDLRENVITESNGADKGVSTHFRIKSNVSRNSKNSSFEPATTMAQETKSIDTKQNRLDYDNNYDRTLLQILNRSNMDSMKMNLEPKVGIFEFVIKQPRNQKGVRRRGESMRRPMTALNSRQISALKEVFGDDVQNDDIDAFIDLDLFG